MNSSAVTGKRSPAIRVLLVEDNPGDVVLMQEALEESEIPNQLYIAKDGYEAMEFLYQRGAYVNKPRPDLVLLDLNLPKIDGRELLAVIKKDPDLKKIPIIIITTSQSEEDILMCYTLYANCYVNKPMGLAQFFEMVKKIEDFWFSTVKLPSR
jgi:CheY-like chemotaxis protein